MVFPPNVVAARVGISVQNLQKEGISFLDKEVVVESIRHLLPVKIEPVFEEGRGEDDEEKCVATEIGANKVGEAVEG